MIAVLLVLAAFVLPDDRFWAVFAGLAVAQTMPLWIR